MITYSGEFYTPCGKLLVATFHTPTLIAIESASGSFINLADAAVGVLEKLSNKKPAIRDLYIDFILHICLKHRYCGDKKSAIVSV